MKKILSALMALALPAMMMAQGWSIKGKIKGLQDGDTLQLIETSHVKMAPMAMAVVKNGQFAFSGQLDSPRGVLLQKSGSWGGETLIIYNEDVTIDGSCTTETQEGQQIVNFDVKIKGSTLTDELNKKQQVKNSLDSLYRATHEPYGDIAGRLYDARMKQDTALVRQLMESDECKKMNSEEKRFFDTVEATYLKMFQDNRDSWWGPYLMIANTSYLTEENKNYYELLTPEAQQSYYGKMVREEVMPNDKAGEKMPLFAVHESEQGEKPLELADVLKTNKYTLVDFWASWCGPCRKEIPNLKKCYELYRQKGFQILSISIDQKVDAWKKACEEEKLPWLSYRDVSGIDALYKVQFIPAMFVLDSEGKLVFMNVRGEELVKKLGELMP